MKHIFNFLLSVFAPYAKFDEYTVATIQEQAETAGEGLPEWLKKIVDNPIVPFILIILTPLVTRLLSRWFDDQDKDGDIDVVDAILEISERIKNKRAGNIEV